MYSVYSLIIKSERIETTLRYSEVLRFVFKHLNPEPRTSEPVVPQNLNS